MRLSTKYDVTLSDVARYLLRPYETAKPKKKNNAAIAGAAFSGFLAGFTAAVLFAPESGSELREDISKAFLEASDKLSQMVEEAKENMA